MATRKKRGGRAGPRAVGRARARASRRDDVYAIINRAIAEAESRGELDEMNEPPSEEQLSKWGIAKAHVHLFSNETDPKLSQAYELARRLDEEMEDLLAAFEEGVIDQNRFDAERETIGLAYDRVNAEIEKREKELYELRGRPGSARGLPRRRAGLPQRGRGRKKR